MQALQQQENHILVRFYHHRCKVVPKRIPLHMRSSPTYTTGTDKETMPIHTKPSASLANSRSDAYLDLFLS